MRAQAMANVLGTTYTNYFTLLPTNADNYYNLSASEWVVTDRLNAATGQNFTSWADYFGPIPENGDYFTLTV